MENKKRAIAQAIFAIMLVIGGGVIGASIIPPEVVEVEKIVYVDKIVEVEKIVYVDRIEYVDRIVYVDRVEERTVYLNMIPVDYYMIDYEIPVGSSVMDWLNAGWSDSYQANGWDCSQMSSYVECVMESYGYDTVIQVSNDHAWVLIELYNDGNYYLYETTGCFFPTSTQGYNAVKQYEDIQDIWDDYKQYSNGEEAFICEWGWWFE